MLWGLYFRPSKSYYMTHIRDKTALGVKQGCIEVPHDGWGLFGFIRLKKVVSPIKITVYWLQGSGKSFGKLEFLILPDIGHFNYFIVFVSFWVTSHIETTRYIFWVVCVCVFWCQKHDIKTVIFGTECNQWKKREKHKWYSVWKKSVKNIYHFNIFDPISKKVVPHGELLMFPR